MPQRDPAACRALSAASGPPNDAPPPAPPPDAAVGVWLRTYAWDHYVTLTPAAPTSPHALRRAFVDGFVRRLTRVAQGPVSWFYAVERGALGGRAHVHALVAGTARLTTAQVARAWTCGYTRVLVYDPERGAAHYVAKGIGGAWDDYDVSRRRPPLSAHIGGDARASAA